MQKKQHIIQVIICIITITLLMITSHVNAQSLTINTETLMLRAETSTQSAILELLSEGEKYEIVEKEGDWYKIKTKENTGYVHKDFVKVEGKQEENVTNVETTNTEATNVLSQEMNTMAENNAPTNTIKEEEPSNTEKEPEEPAAEETTSMGEKMRVSQETKLRVLPLVQAIVLEDLKADTQITIINTCNKWAFVETQAQTGWVRRDMLAPINGKQDISNYEDTTKQEKTTEEDATAEKTTEDTTNKQASNNQKGYVSGTGVNVRSEASSQGQVVEVLNTNAEVTILGQEGDWYKIRYANIEGYILAKFISETKV